MALGDAFITKQDEEIAQILAGINIFEGLSTLERSRIAKFFLRKSYKPNDSIIKESEPGDGMFVIREGAVKVTKSLGDGGEKVLANLVDGNFFGELALLDGYPRSASVIAMNNTDMLELYRASLMELINKWPRIGVKVMFNLAKILGERIRESGDKIKDILIWETLKKQAVLEHTTQQAAKIEEK